MVESAYPYSWEKDEAGMGAPADTCPHSAAEMQAYMREFHHRWSLSEPPTDFRIGSELGSLFAAGRRYWLFEAFDDASRQWFVVLGSGRSIFNPSRIMRRWMLGFEDRHGLSPQRLLEEVARDDFENDARLLSE